MNVDSSVLFNEVVQFYFHDICHFLFVLLELDSSDLHDFNDILKVDQWYSEQYIRFYQEIASPTNTRKRFSTFKKEEIRNYYASCGETVRVFKLQDSTVRKICKADPPERGNKHGGKSSRKK